MDKTNEEVKKEEAFKKFVAIVNELETEECNDRKHRLYIVKELILILIELEVFKDKKYAHIIDNH